MLPNYRALIVWLTKRNCKKISMRPSRPTRGTAPEFLSRTEIKKENFEQAPNEQKSKAQSKYKFFIESFF
jgi:hypothetical protein